MRAIRVLLHPPCIFRLLTRLYCPGCGGTRAVQYLLKGQFKNSIQYHPLVLFIAVIMLTIGINVGLAKVAGKKKWHSRHKKVVIAIAVIIVLINWCWKNYMLIAHGIDLLPMEL